MTRELVTAAFIFLLTAGFLSPGGGAAAPDTTSTARGPVNPDALTLRVALLGNPNSFPEWTDDQVRGLAEAGFNAVQLNIAWLSRPHDEALNLCDVVTRPGDTETSRVAERRAALLRRHALAKKHGLRTIFHFGSPFMWRNPETGEVKRQSSEAFNTNPPWFDTENPKVVEYETALLKEFRKHFPDVDDILVYTYDQDAWQASQFSQSRLSRGVPLHERLPKYLKALHAAWTEGREGHVMWWEPWELSAGQVLKCVSRLPRKDFGLMLHANIAEVQIAHPVDVWFRNTCRMAQGLGIPVVAEGFFGSATEEIQPLAFPTPRLVDEELIALTSVPGVAGVKEYFGVLPLVPDLNLDVFRARVRDPKASTAEILDRITKRFGPAQAEMLRLLELLSDGMQLFPWDASWYARLAGTADINHGWGGAAIRGQQVETPSWCSTRRAHFMKTDDQQPHPYLLEDVQLRCELAVERLDEALSVTRTLLPKLSKEDRPLLEQIARDTDRFRRVAKSYALHLRETNVARLLREDLEAGRPMIPRLLKEMKELLQADAENQGHQGPVMEMIREFEADPEKFIRTRLVPTDKDVRERGIFTLTTR